MGVTVKPSVYWTDSTAVLKYLRNESARFRTFVANRVTTILKGSNSGTMLILRRIQQIVPQEGRRRKIIAAETPANSTRVDKRMTDIKAKWKGSHISVEDLKEAELEIVKFCQREKFAEEISALQRGPAIKRGSSIYSNAAMPEEAYQKVPLVMSLILQIVHEKTGHCGRNHVISTLQQKYWIPGAKSAIRKFRFSFPSTPT
ncbi:hypothetical protein M9458_051730 [Cirrhinus mrigala]|uniref:Integrase zinc-binding domain-containing protein n=1 Tax=Cirrhinus mrigala TaxID=683832 RepID=A0ABD0MUZ2_CIRMR